MTRSILWLLGFGFVLFVFPSLPTAAQTKKSSAEKKPGDEMIEKFLAAETDRLSAKELDGARTLAEWQERRPRLHREYLDMLGLWPVPEKTPLHVTITGTLDHQGVLIDKLHFQSKPGLYVTANLYRPKGNSKKLPTILYLCGHAFRGRDGNKSAHQDHGMWFASNGYNCLILDTLQLGEIPGVHHGTYGTPYRHFGSYGLPGKDIVENRWWWHARGYTPAGVECWNGVRAIDYLVTRPDVDAEHIGVTGISGGGAATFWVSAADERVKVAVPVSGMSDLESYIKNKVINGHCDCMFLYNTYRWEWTTIAALIAPRPLLFANSDNDNIFPMDGNRRIFARLQKLYKMYGKDDLVQEYVSHGGHAYRPDLRVAIFRFLNKYLKDDPRTPVKDADFQPLPGKELRVFPTEADIPKDAINGKIDETFVPLAKVKLPEKGKFAEWKAGLLKELKEKSFRALPEKIAQGGLLGFNLRFLVEVITTEPPIVNYLAAGKVTEKTMQSGVRSLFVVGEHDVAWWHKSKNFVDSIMERGQSFAVATRGLGGELKPCLLPDQPEGPIWVGPGPHIVKKPLPTLDWPRKSPPNYVERSHLLLGRTVDEGKVRDIISAVLYLQSIPKHMNRKWTLVGHGEEGILAAYAALFEPSIAEVIIIDPPKSHREGPIFLNVLRVLDIPEALGMLAPRRLTLISANDPAFDRTEEIYRIAGASDKLTRK